MPSATKYKHSPQRYAADPVADELQSNLLVNNATVIQPLFTVEDFHYVDLPAPLRPTRQTRSLSSISVLRYREAARR